MATLLMTKMGGHQAPGHVPLCSYGALTEIKHRNFAEGNLVGGKAILFTGLFQFFLKGKSKGRNKENFTSSL